ncbi:MAG: beta-ketoacyl-[acyl-carrier-protein] synthase family protein [Dehalococcoidia bacterium]
MRRVVITGIGLITSLGVGTDPTWQGLLDGRSGIGAIQGFNASSLQSQLGGEVKDFEPEQFVVNRRTLRTMTRSDRFAVAAAALAVQDAQLDMTAQDGGRCALFVGSSKEVSDPMQMLEAYEAALNPDGTADIHRFGESARSTAPPLFYVEGLQAASLFYISAAHGLKGANTYFAGTAESGAVAVGTAYRAIRRGEADVALAGGFDDAVSWWTMSKYDALGIMTDRNDLGAAACRPYDVHRTGTVFGEGGAMLLLEEHAAAVARGVRRYAEIVGFGSGHDAWKLVAPHPEGRGLALAMKAALRESSSTPDAITYVAAHGSGTKLGDSSEARAIRSVFGPAVETLVASSIKPATGHLMAGAGALNVAVAALALHHQTVPPTLNLETVDPECRLDWVPGEARAVQGNQAVALARGLEGQNVALVLRAVQ